MTTTPQTERLQGGPKGENDPAWTLAAKVREALDRKACPGYYMDVAVEAVVHNYSPAAPSQPAVPSVLKRGYGRLIQAAADLALQQFMPSDIVDDYPSKTISAAKVAKMMTQPRNRLRLLSIEVSEGAKQMIAAAPAAPAVPQGEPVAWRVSSKDEPELGFWLDEEGPGDDDMGLHYEPLYTAPATPSQETAVNLSCKSTQARLAAQWGYVPAPSQPAVPLTNEFIKEAAGQPEGYKFAAKGISKIDVWPHGGTWFPLYSLTQVQAIIAAMREKERV